MDVGHPFKPNGMQLTALAILLLSCVTLGIFTQWKKGRRCALPPGPPGLPVLGNLLDFPSKELWISAAEWGKKYGDICHLNILGKHIVFVNSPEAAYELLDKRGAIYSDKPQTVMVGELCGLNRILPFISYTPQFRRQRALMQRTLGARYIPQYHARLVAQTHTFMARLVADPQGYTAHIREYAGGLSLGVIYGYSVGTKTRQEAQDPSRHAAGDAEGTRSAAGGDDVYLAMAEECLSLIANRISGAFGVWTVDVFPFLRYIPECMLPGRGWFKREAREFRAKYEQFAGDPWEWAKTDGKESSDIHGTQSFCSNFLQDGVPLSEEMDHDIKWTANSMYAASADTTIATISHFLLAMVKHPDKLAKAQREIDKVVGPDRLPSFQDRAALPYLECVFKETLRWGAPTPVSLPHCLRQDDEYKGMIIPKGSVVLANIWTMLRDETLYPDPFSFNPERFLEPAEPEMEKARDPRGYAFGFGRRRCPGVDLVDASIWLLIVSIASALDISPDVNESGVPSIPDVVYKDSFFRTPSRFRFRVKVRRGKDIQGKM